MRTGKKRSEIAAGNNLYVENVSVEEKNGNCII